MVNVYITDLITVLQLLKKGHILKKLKSYKNTFCNSSLGTLTPLQCKDIRHLLCSERIFERYINK